jgi:DNA repair protein RecO (recombination protein O)
MSAEKTTGIVLRVIEFSETSCIVKLMTRDYGKITAIAKGARRPKSPFEAALDVLAICRIVFLQKTSGAMSLLTEAKLERRFRSSATNLKRLYAGYYVVELLNTLTDEGDPHPDLFDQAIQTITEIDSPDADDGELNLNLLRFELKMLSVLGHMPMLTKCVSCGKEKTTLTRVDFGLIAGGILCENCRRGQAEIVILSPDGLQLLLSLVGGQIGAKERNSDNWNQPDRVKENKSLKSDWSQTTGTLEQTANHFAAVATNSEREVRQLINKYITHLLGFSPKLHKFLQNI